MKLYFNWITLLILCTPLFTNAQPEAIFNDIRLKETFDSATKKLTEISETVDTISIDSPTFPLAKNKEQHLVCYQLQTDNGVIDRAVFTFADDSLHYIMARGNVHKALTEKRTDTAMVYMGYEIYFAEGLFLKKEEDAAWVLTPEATHPNLFVWENPFLDGDYIVETVPSYMYEIPDFLKMGGSLEKVAPNLGANSKFTYTEELDGSDPNAQLQINCFGVDYAGFPRKMEARFGDNKLNVVWILTGKGEEDRIRQALIAQYGDPIFVNDDWEIFNNWQVGLRKDKPEVLLMEQQIGLGYKESYFKQ